MCQEKAEVIKGVCLIFHLLLKTNNIFLNLIEYDVKDIILYSFSYYYSCFIWSI